MSLVILQVRDGRRALLAFTGRDALQSWQPDARPVPVTIDIAAQAARSEELTVVLIDVAGPHPFVIEGEVLAELAAGHRLVELPDGQFGWIIPAPDLACARSTRDQGIPDLGHTFFWCLRS
jgi:hypothetical protein